MKKLGMLCHCKYCKSDINSRFDCGCPTEQGWHQHEYRHIIVDNEAYSKDRIITTGGRWAEWIYLEDDEVAVFYSSNGNPTEIFPNDVNYEEILKNYEPVETFEATVHGCWKIKKHQSLVVYKKKK